MASAHPEGGAGLVADDLRDAWPALDLEERLEGFRLLDPCEAELLFEGLEAREQCALLLALNPGERQLWMRQLAPDDAADAVQAAAPEAARDAARRARRADPPRGGRAAGLCGGRGRRPDEPALRAPASRHVGGRGGRLPAARRARTRRDHLLHLRARRGAAPARRGLVPRPVRRATRSQGAPGDAHQHHLRARRPRPGGGRERDRRERPDGRAGARCRGPHPRHRHRGRHRRRGARGGHRGHPEDRRHAGAGRALPRSEPARDGAEARRLAHRDLRRPAAHHDRDEPVREPARARRRARALHPAGDLERRQLGLAGQHARDPCHGHAGGAAARLVARAAPRARRGPAARPRARRDRPAAGRAVAAARPAVRRALLPDRLDRGRQSGVDRDVGRDRGLDAARSCCAAWASTRPAPRRPSSPRSST